MTIGGWLGIGGLVLLILAASGGERRVTNARSRGDWPTPRQNHHLTAIQPLAGTMRSAPKVVARLDLGRQQGQLQAIATQPGAEPDRVIAIGDGRLRCYDFNGRLLWETHPRGLNFERLVIAEDLDGDGRVELALTAGRPQSPLGAAVLVDAGTGKLRFRYDVEAMSYSWFLQIDRYLPDIPGKQMIVCMHGYPPDKKNGYITLFDWPKRGGRPRQRWRYEFDQYTCFPTLLTTDVNGDGVRELCVETHSRMWVLDPRTGSVVQFIGWNVAPANVRSYGLVRFQDLNGDGRDDFFCIATFAQHHEVLLNEDGRLKLAWAHGWNDSVTTSKIATTYPEPPIADVDGDGRLEMIVSMFQSDDEPRWKIRVYDAITGALKATATDRIAVDVADVDVDGDAEILADITTDPTRASATGACLLKWTGTEWKELWRQDGARAGVRAAGAGPRAETGSRGRRGGGAGGGRVRRGAASTRANRTEPLRVVVDGQTRDLTWDPARGIRLADASPPRSFAPSLVRPLAVPPAPRLDRIPPTVGPTIAPPLVADLDGDGRPEVILYRAGRVTLYCYDRERGFVEVRSYLSDGAPAVADLDGDGKLEIVLGSASPATDPVIRALRPAKGDTKLWEVTLPRPDRPGLPHGRPLYFQTGRFTGRPGDDVYVYAGTPLVRSLVLDGRTGAVVWEKGEVPGTERYFAPTVNLAAVHDVNGDGRDDLVFTNPDYYCVASGPTGEALVGPIIPSKIFDQPSQGLYTMPVVLENRSASAPTVCLVDGHYFVGVMTAGARPIWHRLPEVGEARTGAEGFLRLPDGRWLMGFGRQDGRFACVEVETGKVRWELPIAAAASGVSTCDIDGDGQMEFLFGTSHGQLYAVGDREGRPRLLWKTKLPASVGTPVIADVDGDGASEILVTTGDGYLSLLSGA